MTAFRLYPPTEPQLALIRNPCEERGLEPPETIASLQEGSAIIAAIINRTYNPEDYSYPFRVGTGSTVLIGEPRETDADLAAAEAWHARYDGIAEYRD